MSHLRKLNIHEKNHTPPKALSYQANFQRSFTLIELLIVIAILAILASAMVVVINPGDMLSSSRDSVRMRDLSSLNRSINLLQVKCPNCSLGLPNTIYISIPDTSPTCINLNLPSLPSPWVYSCVTSLNSRHVNGTGWMPINFTASPILSPLSSLPLDPVNSLENGQFYIYTTEGGLWKLTSLLESLRHARSMNRDGGPNTSLYEVGSNLNIANFQRGLVGQWSFEDGAGTTVSDTSGRGNTGTLNLGTQGNTSPANAWTAGQVGQAISFDGSDDFVNVGNLGTVDNFTIETWFFSTNVVNHKNVFHTHFPITGIDNTGVRVEQYTGGIFRVGVSGDNVWRPYEIILNLAPNRWYHLVIVRNGNRLLVYLDGSERINASHLSWPSDFPRMNIGRGHGNFVERHFAGLIDEVRIYNRALSASEIRASFNAGR